MKAIASHERKLVTVLFADLTNSTGLAERLDPEQLQDVMDAYANAVRGAIEAEGGTVEKFIGDAVMAVFGVPAAHEDDAARALRAALRVQWSLEELNDWLAEVHGLTLQAHMGVHIGAVIAATDPQPGERMVTGVAVNIAQRLEESAEPGQIRVSARAARAAAGFRFDEIGPLVLKGIEEPVVAFELLEEAPEEGAERPLFRSPMVAREHEMALLQSVFDRVASEETPHLVTIYGDPGVGKSRLVLEFCAAAESSADGPRARIVRGRCLPYGEGVTYWPLAEILKRHAGVLDSDPPRLALQKVDVVGHEILTPDLAADPARAIAALCHTVGLQRASPGADEGDPRRMHSEISAAWRSYFSAVARSGPTIVVVEDIHWADPALLDLFDELADHAQGALLFLATARPELSGRRPSWGGGRRNRSNLLLEPLAPADVDLLVEALFGGQHLPGSVRSKIVERAGGNPFFVEEIARHLLEETGLTVGGTGGARAASALAVVESVEIPDTLQGVLAARMDLLGRLEKRTLQTASVVGRVFWVGPVARVLAADPLQIEDALGDLEDRGLVLARLSSSIAGEREYLFKHILTRDVAYESLPRRERATLHAEVAAWIESVAGDRWPEFVEPLAHHYGQAYRSARDQPGADQASTEALRERAFRYALDASDQARGKLALDAAERMAEAALELAIGPEQRSRAFEALGDMYFLSSRGELAWASLREAVDARAPTAVAPDADLARAAAKALQVVTRGRGSMRGRLTAEEAAPYLEIALRHLGPEDSEARARLLTVQSFWPYSFRGASHSDLEREAARRAGEEATAMAKRLDRADLAAAALDGVGAYYLSRGLYGRMDDVVARRLDLVPALTDPLEVGDIYAVAAWASFHIGRYAEAVTLADEGYRRAMPSAPVMGLYCLDFRSVGRCRLGDWDGFFADVRLFGELLDERSDRPPGYASDHIAAAAFVHDVREEGALAERQLRILDWLEGVEERPSQGWAVWRALLLSRRGDHASARELLARSEEGSQWGFGYRLEALCDVIGEQEAWDDAASTVDEAHRHAEEAGLLALPHFAGRLSGLAALAGGDVGVGIDLLTRASAGFAERGAAWEAARTDVRLAEALARNGHDQEASSRALAALAVLEPMRSMREVADARRLLG